MRAWIAGALLFTMASYARDGRTQDPSAESRVPPPRTGFQLGLRTGLSVPVGNARGMQDLAMSDVFSPQVPIFVEIGGKPVPNVFIGGYFGLGFGGPAGILADDCKNATCIAVSARFGVEAQYHILPENSVNPWVGYGIGFESAVMGMSINGESSSAGYGGLEFAHLMGGADFRLSRVFGLGPFADVALGQYSRYRADVGGRTTIDGSIDETRTHGWITVGLRTVFFP